MKKTITLIFSIVIFIILINIKTVYAQDYYVSNSGDDFNTGTSIYEPWETILKVNNFHFKPGDVIHFKKGDIWREQLIPVSGNEKGYVKYTSYGVGDKPLFLGSVDRSSASYWKNIGDNIWTFSNLQKVISSIPVVPIDKIIFWKEKNVDVSYSIFENWLGKRQIKIEGNNSGESIYDIRVSLKGLKIEKGKNYTFTFRAKATETLKIPCVTLMKDDSPWSDSATIFTERSHEVSSKWKDYSISYQANIDDDNARVTMYLGESIPKGAMLYIDSISFFESNNLEIYDDVGNIIFNGGEDFGVKVFSEGELNEQNQFYYDEENHTVKIYSMKNPGELYNQIECALTKNIINEVGKSYIIYDGLALKYGSAHGIGGGGTHHIKVMNCDIGFIGGGKFIYRGEITRYGNGIEFWNSAYDNLVEGCNIEQIYDSGFSIQGIEEGNELYNIIFRNNKIQNAQWSFEVWYSNENSFLRDIYFENNICENAGYGWARNQRTDDGIGVHLGFFPSSAKVSNVFIRNNTFKNAKDMSSFMSYRWNDFENLILYNNTYVQPQNNLVVTWRHKEYYTKDFRDYQNETQNDKKSVLILEKNICSNYNKIPEWAKFSVKQMIEKNIMDLKRDGSFPINEKITRGEFAAYISRVFGLKAKNNTMPFTDVSENYKYRNEIMAAYQNDIIKGINSKIFNPEGSITREQVATIIMRAIRLTKGDSLNIPNMIVEFKDSESISSYAAKSVSQITSLGLYKGYEDGTIKPQGKITFCESAVLLDRAYDEFV